MAILPTAPARSRADADSLKPIAEASPIWFGDPVFCHPRFQRFQELALEAGLRHSTTHGLCKAGAPRTARRKTS